MQYVIGVDIGTTGTKAIAVNESGQILATAYEAYPFISWHPDQHELDPVVLSRATQNTVASVIRELGIPPACLSFSSALHSLIAVDERHLPLTQVITWADTRSKEMAAVLKDSELGSRIYEHTGTPIHPMSPLCKILWLRHHRPDLFMRAAKFISIKEYIWFEWFGEYQIDYGLASGTGLFDIRRLDWYDESLQYAGITKERLSRAVSPYTTGKAIRKNILDKLGLTKSVPVVIGGADGCLANLGCLAIHPGDLALTIGTSGAVRMVSGSPTRDPAARVFNYILDETHFVTGGAINNGGIAVKWYVEHFMQQGADLSELVAQTEQIAPGTEGLIFLPYLLGERAPVWDADAKGVFFGIYSGHTALHFLRAVLEGISFSLYQIARVLEETVGPVQTVYASGGFIHSRVWLQMLADIFNKPIRVTNTADASAIGAAILGLCAIGLLGDFESAAHWVNEGQIFQPDPTHHARYQRNYAVFSVLYEKLKHEFAELSNLRK